MSQSPTVSVIMNCYNSDRYLKEAIDSVYAQTFTDWEIIFWDNASTDSSAEIAASYDNKLCYFKGDQNVSLGEARNFALSKARGRYLCFLDCDDTWLPEKLKKQIAAFATCQEVDFIYTNYVIFETEKNTRKTFLTGPQPEGYVFENFLYDYPVGMLTVMLKKECLDSLGSLFDENLHLMEEFDVFMRILFRHQAKYLPEETAVYRVHNQMNSYVHRERWGAERGYLAEKFKEMDSSPICHKAYEIMMWKKIYNEALLELIKGETRTARQKISPMKFFKVRAFIVYFISFLPSFCLKIMKVFMRSSVYLR